MGLLLLLHFCTREPFSQGCRNSGWRRGAFWLTTVQGILSGLQGQKSSTGRSPGLRASVNRNDMQTNCSQRVFPPFPGIFSIALFSKFSEQQHRRKRNSELNRWTIISNTLRTVHIGLEFETWQPETQKLNTFFTRLLKCSLHYHNTSVPPKTKQLISFLDCPQTTSSPIADTNVKPSPDVRIGIANFLLQDTATAFLFSFIHFKI